VTAAGDTSLSGPACYSTRIKMLQNLLLKSVGKPWAHPDRQFSATTCSLPDTSRAGISRRAGGVPQHEGAAERACNCSRSGTVASQLQRYLFRRCTPAQPIGALTAGGRAIQPARTLGSDHRTAACSAAACRACFA
jgi:hypothetical protein